MDLKIVNRLAMIGISMIGIGNMWLSPAHDSLEIQKNVLLDMYDLSCIEREVEERKRQQKYTFDYKNYTFEIKH